MILDLLKLIYLLMLVDQIPFFLETNLWLLLRNRLLAFSIKSSSSRILYLAPAYLTVLLFVFDYILVLNKILAYHHLNLLL